MKQKIFFSIFIGLISLLSFSLVQAMITPQVYFTDLNLSKTTFDPGEKIQGTVSLWNYEELVVSDLKFHFQLLGGEIDGVATEMIDEQIGEETFAIAPGEKVTKSFSYNLPSNLPKGGFKFSVQLATSRGEEMSWIDRVISIGGEGKFLTLDNYWIVRDEEKLSSGGGVNYQPEEIPEICFDVSNNSGFTITAFSKVTTYKRNVGGEIFQETSEKTIILQPGQKQTKNLFLPKLTKPESYLSEVRFYDSTGQEPISNSIYFRWIIAGEDDAEILFVNPDKESYQAGEEAEVQVKFAGPAGTEIEGGEGCIMVSLYDQAGNLVGRKEECPGLGANQITIKVPIEKDIDNLKVVTQITRGGKIIDQYEFQARPIEEMLEEMEQMGFFERNKKILISLLIALILIISIVLIIYCLKIKKKKAVKTLTLLILFGTGLFGGVLFSNYASAATEVTGGNCDTTIVFNNPLPNRTYESGDTIHFSGQFRVTSCGDGLFHNKIEFFITEDREIPIKNRNCCSDCCGGTSPMCGTCCQNIGWCSEVKILDQSQSNVYRLGTIYPPDVAQGAHPYWVVYNQYFTIPSDLGFLGPVRFYVQYSGTHWGSHWHWNITYQKGTIIMPDYPPVAAISCDPSNCANYYGFPLTLVNASTDPNGDSDIVKSKWFKKLQGEPDSAYQLISYCDFNKKSNCTLQMDVGPGNYTAKLYIEDSVGNSDTAVKNFQIRNDALAGFMCSLNNEDWYICEDIEPFSEERIYLKDDPSLTEHSIPSDGAVSIDQRTWKLEDEVFDFDNNANPSVILTEESNDVTLVVADNIGRTASKTHTVSTQAGFPDWKEIPPY